MDPREFTDLVLKYAETQLGVMEVPLGSNKGPQINEYLKSVGDPPGVPWCASFTYFCIEQAAKKAGILQIPMVRTGYCPTIAQWAEGNKCLYAPPKGVPQAGDLFLLHINGHYRHTGFVTSVFGTRFSTIEGNADVTGSPNGIGVFKRERPINNSYAFVRYRETMPDATGAATIYQLFIGNQKLTDMQVLKGTAWCPIRVWADHFGMSIGWNNDTQSVLLNGRVLNHDISVVDGVSYAPIRELATLSGFTLAVDTTKKTVTVTWPQGYQAPPASPASIITRPPGK